MLLTVTTSAVCCEMLGCAPEGIECLPGWFLGFGIPGVNIGFLFTLGFRKICRDIDIFRYPVIVQKIREYPVIIVILLNVEKSDILVLFCLFLL